MQGAARALKRRIEALFPERQVFIRANGRVRFFTLSRYPQMALAAVPVAVLTLFAVGAVIKVVDEWTMARMSEVQQVRLAELDTDWRTRYRELFAERDRLARDLDESRELLRVERITAEHKYQRAIDDLADRQRRFKALLAQRQDLESETRRLGVAIDHARTRREAAEHKYTRVIDDLAVRQRRIKALLGQRQNLESETGRLGVAIDQARTGREAAERAAHDLRKRYTRTRERLTRAGASRMEPRGSLRAGSTPKRLVFGGGTASGDNREPGNRFMVALEAYDTDRLVQNMAADRLSAEHEAATLRRRVSRLEARLINLRDSQSSLIAQIEDGASGRIDEIESVIQLTGLDLERLVDRARGNIDAGIGGPLTVLAGRPTGPWESGTTPLTHPDLRMTLEQDIDYSIARMGARLARWSALNSVMRRLPLAAPLEKHKLTSRFGRRRDPFNRRWAMHNGVDLGGSRGSAILAAAPGIVSYIGWKGPYGRMIEIDHGYGLKTRYGHLYRTRVKRGDRVAARQSIALIGSSGRSTGRHLHYEVRFDDLPLDPITFLKAGRHVLKDGQK